MLSKFLPEKSRFDFIGKRWIGFAFSLFMSLIAIISIADKGLNWGIDFAGGLLLEVRDEQPIDLAKMRGLFGTDTFGEVTLQHMGQAQDVMIRVKVEDDANQAALTNKVQAVLKEGGFENLEYRRVDFVGPTVGQEMIEGGSIAVLLSVLGIMAYVWFRFEWQFSLGGALALLHDGLMVMGFYAFTQFEFGLASIAAVLTILGYSINDSVVIYDRIRENLRKYKKMPVEELLNLSLNETLSRTILTVLTTFLAVLALVIFGGEVIRGFSAAILFGLVVGTYSSVYVSGAILIYLNLRNKSAITSEEPISNA